MLEIGILASLMAIAITIHAAGETLTFSTLSLAFLVIITLWLRLAAKRRLLGLNLSTYFIALYMFVAIMYVIRAVFPDLLLSSRAIQYQSDDLLRRAGGYSLLGLCAFLIGWCMGYPRRAVKHPPRVTAFHDLGVGSKAFFPALLMALVCALMVVPRQTILQVGYGYTHENTIAAALELNTLKTGAHLSLLIAAIAYCKEKTKVKRIILIACIVMAIIGLGFIAGHRVEEVGLIMAVCLIVLRSRGAKKVPRQWYAAAIALVAFLQILGLLRSEFTRRQSFNDISVFGVSRELVSILSPDERFLKIATGGDIAVTFTALIGVIDNSFLEHDLGQTFVNYIYSTVPKSIYPERPPYLSESMYGSPFYLTNGGLFLLCEPYLSFGVCGIIVSMFVIGWAVGFIERVSNVSDELSFFIYIVLVYVAARFVMYGIVNVYKCALMALLMLVCTKLMSMLTAKSANVFDRSLFHRSV